MLSGLQALSQPLVPSGIRVLGLRFLTVAHSIVFCCQPLVIPREAHLHRCPGAGREGSSRFREKNQVVDILETRN